MGIGIINTEENAAHVEYGKNGNTLRKRQKSLKCMGEAVLARTAVTKEPENQRNSGTGNQAYAINAQSPVNMCVFRRMIALYTRAQYGGS